MDITDEKKMIDKSYPDREIIGFWVRGGIRYFNTKRKDGYDFSLTPSIYYVKDNQVQPLTIPIGLNLTMENMMYI